MQKRFTHRLLLLLAPTVLLATLGCSQRSNAPNSASSVVVRPAPSPVPTSSPVQATATDESYKLAIDKAKSAQNLSQTALSEDDWNLVASRWQQAIDYLKVLPPASPYQAMAKVKLAEFEKGRTTAQKWAGQAKLALQRNQQSGAVFTEPLKVTSAIAQSPGSGKVFQAPIKRRAGGTPVIDVTFNGTQTFEMIVDTGASGTVITQQMADTLGVRVIGKTKVSTASQVGVEVPLAFVESIAVGEAVVKEVVVAIGNNALDIGLLGHDFFSDYDVTVKQDVVEFRKR
ncbi:MAG: retroviral-like aspartic protease family protein [Oscillatoriales cyanobacterium C42_A2020_001]|nr:retroviral-like aspartic protease family protein [Leptolyngbyaceae cyanobacterium C42_A2020_001]